MREYPWDGRSNRFYTAFGGSIPDLWGYGTITYDELGNRIYMQAAPFDYAPDNSGIWGVPHNGNINDYMIGTNVRDGKTKHLPVLFDNPYLFDPNASAGGADEPFTAAELEAILRVQDFDLSSLPPRLLAILTDKLDYQVGYGDGSDLRALRKMSRYVTTASNDIPSPPRYLGPRAPGIFSLTLKCAGEDADTIIQRLPPEVFEGRRVDLNRLAKDPDVVAPANPERYMIGLKKRAKFAEEIFTLLMLLAHDQLAGYTEPGLENDATLTGKEKQWMVTRLAQWAVNLVDYLDPDDASTPFVFDLNPFDGGWANDANTFRFIDGDDTVIGAVKAGTSGGKPINLVWGMERSNILISETMALHNRRTADTDQDSSGKTTQKPEGAPAEETPDDDFDQVLPPQTSLFVELYNAADPNRPDTVRSGSTASMAVNLAQPWGNGTYRSLYRLAVGEKTFEDTYVEGENAGWNNIAYRAESEAVDTVTTTTTKRQPHTFTFQPKQYHAESDFRRSHVCGQSVPNTDSEDVEVERFIWFHPQDKISPDLMARYGSNDTRSYWNAGNAIHHVDSSDDDADNAEDFATNAMNPNEYLVIGPRVRTYFSSRANATGNVYAADITEIKTRQAELWEQQNKLLEAVNKIAEGR